MVGLPYMPRKNFLLFVIIFSIAALVLVHQIARLQYDAPTKIISLPILNDTQVLEYIMIPDLSFCSHLPLLVIVQSAPESFDIRKAIRETWTNRNQSIAFGNGTARTLFLIGTPEEPSVELNLRNEFNEYGDIVMYSGKDSYRNLVYKTLVMLHFHNEWCTADILLKKNNKMILFFNTPKTCIFEVDWHQTLETVENILQCNLGDGGGIGSYVSFLVQIDEDVIFHLDRFLLYLSQFEHSKLPFVAGYVSSDSEIIRDPKHRWYVPEDILNGTQFPTYAKGLGYAISKEAVPILLEKLPFHPKMELEDAYVTGILVLGTPIQHIKLDRGVVLESQMAPNITCKGTQTQLPYIGHQFKSAAQIREQWKLMREQTCV